MKLAQIGPSRGQSLARFCKIGRRLYWLAVWGLWECSLEIARPVGPARKQRTEWIFCVGVGNGFPHFPEDIVSLSSLRQCARAGPHGSTKSHHFD